MVGKPICAQVEANALSRGPFHSPLVNPRTGARAGSTRGQFSWVQQRAETLQRPGMAVQPQSRAILVRSHTQQNPHQSRRTSWWWQTSQNQQVATEHQSSLFQHIQAHELEPLLTKHCAQDASSSASFQHLIIMFSATWCGPCKIVTRELDRLLAIRPPGSLRVAYMDLSEGSGPNSQLASELGIQSLPTLVFVGTDRSRRSICTIGNVSAPLLADVLDTKMHLCGADLANRLRLS